MIEVCPPQIRRSSLRLFTISEKIAVQIANRSLKHHSVLRRPRLKMQQDIRILKQKCNDRPMSWPSLVKLGLRTPEKALSVLTHPLKLHGENVPNRR